MNEPTPPPRTRAEWSTLIAREEAAALRLEMRQDIRRARDEARTPQLNLPQSNISYGPVE